MPDIHANARQESWARPLRIRTLGWFHADPPSPALARRSQPCTRVWQRKSSIRRRGPGGQYSARKSFDVQVFHRDQPVAFHQPTAEIMMKGGTLVSDFTVRLGHECGGLAAAVAAALATGKPALGAAQVCQPALEVSGIVDLHAIRKSDKAIQSDIHADILGRLRQRHTVSLDGKTHVPVVHVPLDRNGLDLTLHRPVQFDLDETSALDTQLPVFEPSAAIAVGRKGDTVVPPERTEAREAGLLAASYANEERLEGLIQPAEHILAAGEVGQSEQPFFPHRLQLLGRVVVVDALAANFPSIAPFLKGGVVELASLVELVLEKPSLGLVGVQAVFVGGAHKQEYTKSIGLRQTKSEDARICKRRPHSPVT